MSTAVSPTRIGRPLVACETCGLIQHVPSAPTGFRAVCRRCETPLFGRHWHQPQAAVGLALAALVLFPPAILLPVLKINKLGHAIEDSIVSGVATLMSDGHIAIGLIVLVFSLIVPPLKLVALLALATGHEWLNGSGRATVHRFVERLGKWGMLDVLVVAVLIAYVKLGDTVTIQPGPGLVMFAGCVLLSLLASFCLHPPALWENENP